MHGRHLNGAACVPWYFDEEPHVAYDGKVYCPRCTALLGTDMGKAIARGAVHRQALCQGWAEGVRRNMDAGHYDEELARDDRVVSL